MGQRARATTMRDRPSGLHFMVEQEERYRTLVELSPDAIAIHRDGRLVFSNSAGLRMLGARSLSEVAGRPLLQFVAAEYHEIVRTRVREATEQRIPQPPIDLRLVRVDGTTVEVKIQTTPVTFEGQPALISFAHDMTEYNRAQRVLERTISLQQATLESTADGLLVVDSEGRIVSYNRKFAEMWRIPAPVLESRDDRAAISYVLDQLTDPGQFLSKVQELYAHRDAKSFDVLEFKDGRTFERYSQPQRIGGRSIGRVWSFRDVTERQRLAQRVARLEKMEAVARLASGVAHDFNNLLTIVGSYADLLMQQLAPDESHRADVQQIKRAAERAASLARQLLLFSRGLPHTPARVSLRTFFEELRPILERLLRPEITLSIRPAPDSLEVVADASQLERVMINLVMNAVDATAGAGSITIRVERSQLDARAAFVADVEPGAFATIVISDTGSGMTPDTLAHLFEPFFTTKPSGQGSGLGLATAFGIIRQAGGQIDVDSTPGLGSTFRILLPTVAARRQPA